MIEPFMSLALFAIDDVDGWSVTFFRRRPTKQARCLKPQWVRQLVSGGVITNPCFHDSYEEESDAYVAEGHPADCMNTSPIVLVHAQFVAPGEWQKAKNEGGVVLRSPFGPM
jgi:hypothetical protein